MGKFLPNHAEVTRPMTALLSPKSSWIWGLDQINAFNKVKEELTKNPKVLALYNSAAEIRLSADASSYGIRSTFAEGRHYLEANSICFLLNVFSRIVLCANREGSPCHYLDVWKIFNVSTK